MKAIILAGGLGTRISEETSLRPKPMVEIGGLPILWHVMKIYSSHGINDFIICLGYKGYVIKEYFANYYLHNSDVTFDLASNEMVIHSSTAEPWRVTLVDTGQDTMTGGRLKRIKKYLDDEDFCFTYGDGVGSIDIPKLLKFHKDHGKLATLTCVQPPGRFGTLKLNGVLVEKFEEKPSGESNINGGFFVLSPKVIDYIDDDHTSWELEPLERLALAGELAAYTHAGFWQPMDTLRDKNYLEALWLKKDCPWRNWK
jgi:glucose-1-phosphate cytidylyltransferase